MHCIVSCILSDGTQTQIDNITYPGICTSISYVGAYTSIRVILANLYRYPNEAYLFTIFSILNEGIVTSRVFNSSDAFTINGQPGDFSPCSGNETYNLKVEQGKTYLLRIINALRSETLFFAIAKHKLTVVGADASYTKPQTTDYITIAPGQTLDTLLHSDQESENYYMAARTYKNAPEVPVENTTATAILRYLGNYTASSLPPFPNLPDIINSSAAFNFTQSLKSLNSGEYRVHVPLNVTTRWFSTISLNLFPCVNNSCQGPNGSRFAARMKNISFVIPNIDILQAYYNRINGVFTNDFPISPPLIFNFTFGIRVTTSFEDP